jgi:hypothetical protein
MLNKIGLRFQKEIHKRFANPVKGRQPDSGNNHRFHESRLLFKLDFHAGKLSFIFDFKSPDTDLFY